MENFAKERKMTQYLETINLCKSYNKRSVVKQVSIRVEQGQVVGLLGANGAGKSTTFRMVAGLIRPDSGQVILSGKDISKLPMYKRAEIGIGYLPQEPTIFKQLTVRDNIMIVLQHLKMSYKERQKKLRELLGEMKLEGVVNSHAKSLSGGERRRLEVTRILTLSPKFMMWDEPFAAVDPKIVEALQDIIRSLKERGLGILVTDHKAPETLSISDYGYIINEGEILLQGNPSMLAADKKVREVYLGDSIAIDAISDISSIIKEAKLFFSQKDYDNAISILTNIVKQKSNNDKKTDEEKEIDKENKLQIHLLRGKCFIATGEYPSAKFDFNKVLNFFPENKEAQEKLKQVNELLSC